MTKKRVWQRFSLRAFLVCVTLFSLSLGVFIVRSKQQQKAVRWCLVQQGSVDYDSNYDFDKHISGPEPPEQEWHQSDLLRDFVSTVVQIRYTSNGSDPSALKCLSCLDMLVIYDAKTCDVETLDAFPKLKVLQLLGKGIDDLSPLANLTNVEQLGLEDIHVDDLKPLSKLNLESLMIFDSDIEDFSAIMKHTELKLLILKNTDISQEATAELKVAMPNCHFQIMNPAGTKSNTATVE